MNNLPLQHKLSAHVHTNLNSSHAPEDFLTATIALFHGTQSGHMGAWRYYKCTENPKASGADLWEELACAPQTYNILKNGDRCLSANTQIVKERIEPVSAVVEFGPGHIRTTEKTFLNGLIPNGTYVPVDISEQFLGMEVLLEQEHVVGRVSPIQADFMRSELTIPVHGKKLFLMRGITIGNTQGGANTAPAFDVITLLSTLKQNMVAGDTFLFDFDSSTQESDVLRCYNDRKSIAFTCSILHRIAYELRPAGSFNPDHYVHECVWYPETNQCAHTVVAQDDQQFIIENHLLHVRAGQRLYLSNSYKFSETTMLSYLRRAGFKDCEIIGTDDNPIKLALARV